MNGSDMLGLGGLLVGLIGVVIAVISHRRSVQAPDMRYVVDMTRVLTVDDWLITNGLLVTFNTREIQGVCRSYIAVWNHRGAVVKGAEILDSDPLRIVLDPSDSILQIRLVNRTRQQLLVRATTDPSKTNTATVNFDHLAAGDGFVIEVIHHEPAQPRLLGTVRGIPITRKPSMSLDDAQRHALRSGWKMRWKAYGFLNYYFPIVFGGTAVFAAILALNPPASAWVADITMWLYQALGIELPASRDQLYTQAAGSWIILVIISTLSTIISLLNIHRKLRQKVPKSVFQEEAPFTDEAVIAHGKE